VWHTYELNQAFRQFPQKECNKNSLDNLLAIDADGTNVNTGLNNGAMRLLELHKGHPVQFQELPRTQPPILKDVSDDEI